MNIATLAQILFFGVTAVDYFFPFKGAGIIIAISAGIVALSILIPYIKKLLSRKPS